MSASARALALGELVDEVIRLYHLFQRVERELHGEGDLSESERSVVFALFSDGPQSVPELARERCRTRQRIQQLVNTLTNRGLVRRKRNPVSDKSPLYALSARGSQRVTLMLRKEQRLYAELISGTSVHRLRETRRNLRDLGQRLRDRSG